MFPDRGGDLRHDHVLVDELVGRAGPTSGVHRARPRHGAPRERNPIPRSRRTRRRHRCRRRGTCPCHRGSRRRSVTALQTFRCQVRCKPLERPVLGDSHGAVALADDRPRPGRHRGHRARATARSRPDRPGGRATSASTAPCAVSWSTASASVSLESARSKRLVERRPSGSGGRCGGSDRPHAGARS